MDVKAYIASGVLEDYALGTATDRERREVQCLASVYPEIREALGRIESDLESFASAYAEKPPAELRERVMRAVAATEVDPPMRVEPPADAASGGGGESARSADKPARRHAWIGWAAAAGLAAGVAIWQFVEHREAEDRLAETREMMDRKIADMESMAEQIAELHSDLVAVYGTDKRKVVLDAVQSDDRTRLALLWDTETGQVNIHVSALPQLPADEQYQLWVLVDGEPKSMGVLPKDVDGVVAAEGRAENGDAFAITVEPLGGSETPTLERMVVMGKT